MAAQERARLTQQDPHGGSRKDALGEEVYLMRSRYDLREQSAVAPVQLVSGMGHVYVFRQSRVGTLYVDRFVLDGLSNTLRPKLEVRYRRSRQRHAPQKPSGADGRLSFDSLNFHDADNREFFEPTTELVLINNLRDGWFSVVLLPTDEHEHFCWNIVAFNSETARVEITSLAASDEGLFTLNDGRVSGVIRRQLAPFVRGPRPGDPAGVDEIMADIQGVPVTTRYEVQQEKTTKAGPQLMRTATRVMVAVPTALGLLVVDFAAARDGTLSKVAEAGAPTQLRADVRAVTLPLNTLDEIRAEASASDLGGGAGPARGRIAGLGRDEADRLLLQAQPRPGATPLSAIVEGSERQVVDFSPFERHGLVHGAVHVGGRTLRATLRDGVTPVTTYRNDELVSVSAGARYEESFEFRLSGANGANGAAVAPTAGEPPVFQFFWHGKRSRSADEWIAIADSTDANGADGGRTLPFERLGDGWFKATGLFTVPADSGIALVRTFFLRAVQSQRFAELTVRRHQLRLVSDTVSQVTFSDSWLALSIGPDSAATDAALDTLARSELAEPPVAAEIALLRARLASLSNLLGSSALLADLEVQLSGLLQERIGLEARLKQEQSDRCNFRCRLFWRDFLGNGRTHDQYLVAVVDQADRAGNPGRLGTSLIEQEGSLWIFVRHPGGLEQFQLSSAGQSTTAPMSLIQESTSTTVRLATADAVRTGTTVGLKFWRVPNEAADFSIRTPDGNLELRLQQGSLGLVDSGGATLHNRWGLKPTQEASNTRAELAERDLRAKLAQMQPLAAQTTELRLVVEDGASKGEQWVAELHAAEQRLAELLQAMAAANLSLTTASQPPALKLLKVATDSRALTTTGALLAFARPASQPPEPDGNLRRAAPAGVLRHRRPPAPDAVRHHGRQQPQSDLRRVDPGQGAPGTELRRPAGPGAARTAGAADRRHPAPRRLDHRGLVLPRPHAQAGISHAHPRPARRPPDHHRQRQGLGLLPPGHGSILGLRLRHGQRAHRLAPLGGGRAGQGEALHHAVLPGRQACGRPEAAPGVAGGAGPCGGR